MARNRIAITLDELVNVATHGLGLVAMALEGLSVGLLTDMPLVKHEGSRVHGREP